MIDLNLRRVLSCRATAVQSSRFAVAEHIQISFPTLYRRPRLRTSLVSRWAGKPGRRVVSAALAHPEAPDERRELDRTNRWHSPRYLPVCGPHPSRVVLAWPG